MGRIKTFLKNINYLSKHSLWQQREDDIVYLTDKILSDGYYEYDLYGVNKPLKILSKTESLDLIINNPKSFLRTGDGEIKLMMGLDQPFQKYEPEIAKILKDILSSNRDDIYVGLNNNYFIPSKNQGDGEYYRRHAYDFRNFYIQNCNKDKTFIDATVTSLDFEKNGTEEANEYYAKLKSLFDNKKLCLVIGKGILDKLTYNIFKDGKDIIEIDAPKINAWDEHKRILNDIKTKASKEYIVVFCLGMAGKAMIPELTDCGYVCYDVGHLVKYYDEAMKNHILSKEEKDEFYAPD